LNRIPKTLIAMMLAMTIVMAACTHQKTVDSIIYNVTIVDVADGSLLQGQAVVVEDGKISSLINAAGLDNFSSDQVINGKGGYLIPALADAHVHIQSRSELLSYIRHGVGLVINMSGSPLHLQMREEVNSHSLPGPDIVTVGPTLDGEDPTNPLFTSVSPETASDLVAWIKNQGYDAVKVYQQMDAATLEAVIEAGDDQGLIVTGHVSREIGIEGVIATGLKFVAHGEELTFEAFDETSRAYDQAAIPALVNQLVEANVTVTPMIDYLETIPPQVVGLSEFLDSPAMQYLPV